MFRYLVGKVRIADVEEFLGMLKAIARKYSVAIQAMDAGLIAGEAHIKSAVQKAVRAIQQGNSITNDLGMEILLYAAGRRQIERALTMGVSTGDDKMIVIVIAGDSKDMESIIDELKRGISMKELPHEVLETITDEKRLKLKRFFNITDAELKAVGEDKLKQLVLERVALLEVYK